MTRGLREVVSPHHVTIHILWPDKEGFQETTEGAAEVRGLEQVFMLKKRLSSLQLFEGEC